MKKKEIILYIFTIGSTLIVVALYSKGLVEFLVNLLFIIAVWVGSSIMAGYISLRVKKKLTKATEEELRTEDSVFLRGIGLLQSTIFIYLNIVPIQDRSVLFALKYLIPMCTGIFFTLRGYGAIKRSNVHRLWSTIVLIWFLSFEVLAYVVVITDVFWGDVKLLFLFVGFVVVLLAISDKFVEILSTRYGVVFISRGRRKELEMKSKGV